MGAKAREHPKGSGIWYVFINHNRKRKSVKVGKKADATKLAVEIEKQIALDKCGLLDDNEVPTVAEFGKKYVNDPGHEWAANTRSSYLDQFENHIKPHKIARKPIDEVRLHHVKDFLGDLNQKGLAKKTIQVIKSTLHGIFEEALVYKYIEVNPCANTGKWVKSNGKEKAKGEVNTYTAEEAAKVIEASKSLRARDHALIMFLTRTGVRVGEALGLSWGDIDFENRIGSITKSWDYTHKKMNPTKNTKSRKVNLTPMAVEALKQWRQETKYPLDVQPIFCTDEGDRLYYEAVRRQYVKIRLRDNVTLHDLRHTYASIRISKGDPPIDVCKQLGHSNLSMTLDVYSHWLPQKEYQQQVDELDTLHLDATYTQPSEMENNHQHLEKPATKPNLH